MSDIDPSKIKPGDTVRVRVRTRAMRERGIDPYEFTSQAYRHFNRDATLPCSAGGFALDITDDVTILEHIPARPDWADALVVRAADGFLWVQRPDDYWAGPLPHGHARRTAEMEQCGGPITVVLDADGNPPTPEHPEREVRPGWEIEVLHPEATEDAREALSRYQDDEGLTHREMQAYLDGWDSGSAKAESEPEWLDADALNDLPDDSLVMPGAENRPRVRHLGGWYRVPGGVGHLPRAIAPARVLWTPDA